MKKLLISIAFISLIAAAVVFATTQQSEAPAIRDSETSKQTDKPDALSPAPDNKQPGQYLDYSQANLGAATGQRVLFFHAPWCYQCQQLDADIKKQGVPDGFTILKVDYDSNQALRQKYGITFRTALIKVDANGNATSEEYIAYKEPTLAAVKRDFLSQ